MKNSSSNKNIPKSDKIELIVIGGGPAGMMAAGTAAQAGLKVTLLEKMPFSGLKLRITGKGRCNITNKCDPRDFIDHFYDTGRFLISSLNQFTIDDCINFFNNLGIETILERGNRIFPKRVKAVQVQQAMIKWLNGLGVKTLVNHKVLSISECETTKNPPEYLIKGLNVDTKNKISFKASRLIIATGGKSYPRTGSTGEGYSFLKTLDHTIIPTFPGLVPLTVEDPLTKQLSGLTLKNCCASLYINSKKIAEKSGEVTFYPKGLTGPVILNISRFASKAIQQFQENKTQHPKISVIIDLKPALDQKKLDLRLQREINSLARKKVEDLLKKLLPSQIISFCSNKTGVSLDKKLSELSKKDRNTICNWIKGMAFSIKNTAGFNEAIITCGGQCIKEFNPKTMESKKHRGLYVAGELFNLQADTGGFNLQCAFSTGYTAGISAANDFLSR